MQATNIIIAEDHVDITLNNSVERGDTLNTQYIPGTNKVQDLSGNEAAAFNLPVTITLWPNGSCTDLLLTVIDYQTIQADWINGSTDETGIIAYISTDQVTWTPYTLAAGTETNNFTGLTASTLFYVRVRAVKDGYYSDYTDVESATTEAGAPAILSDGNTVGWYDFMEGVTKDASDFVSVWADKSLSNNNLIQENGSKQPKWYVGDGIFHDGIDDALYKNLALPQPIEIYIVIKPTGAENGNFIFILHTVNVYGIRKRSTPTRVDFGSMIKPITNDVFSVIEAVANGASSSLRVNNGTPSAVNNTYTLSIYSTGYIGGTTAQGYYKEIIIRKINDTDDNKLEIRNYLITKYSIT